MCRKTALLLCFIWIKKTAYHFTHALAFGMHIFRGTASTPSWLETWGWSTRRTHRTKRSTLWWHSRCRGACRSVLCARSTLPRRWRWTINGLRIIPAISASSATTSSTTRRTTRCYTIIAYMITSRSKCIFFERPKAMKAWLLLMVLLFMYMQFWRVIVWTNMIWNFEGHRKV